MLMSNKPLHRFLGKDPTSFGISILIFGCAEMLMGFQLVYVHDAASMEVYYPFGEGALFAVCGILSICTNRHPSKRMVTVCLAMYIVSILGFFVFLACRVIVFHWTFMESVRSYHDSPSGLFKVRQIVAIESIMFIFSTCVLVLLIFLSAVARFALKSTHTEVVVRWVTNPPADTTLD